MTFNLRDLFPTLQPALEGITQLPFVRFMNETVWIFALVETGHLLFLAILGGAVLTLNFRLLGIILPEVPAEEVEQATWRWYRLGAVGTIVTGLVMGITTLRTLLPNGAFFVKLLALFAAIALSGVAIRQARGQASAVRDAIATISGLLIWIFSLYLFATTATLNSGSFLIALTGGTLLAATVQPRHRIAAISLAIISLAGWFASLDALGSASGTGGQNWYAMPVIAIIILAVIAAFRVTSFSVNNDGKKDGRHAIAFATTLAWVTVAAAGRWIGFS